MTKFNDFFKKYIELNDFFEKKFENTIVDSIDFDKFSKKVSIKLIDDSLIKQEDIQIIKEKLKDKLLLNEVEIIILKIDNKTKIQNKKYTNNKISIRKGEFLLPKPIFENPSELFGGIIKGEIKTINDIKNYEECIFWGDIFEIKTNEIKKTTINIIRITDYVNSISLKIFKDESSLKKINYLSSLKKWQTIVVKGRATFDSFENEIVVNPLSINIIKKYEVVDEESEKRVELHLHTSMSSMDGVTSVSKFINKAYEWGHDAIAITDHGVLQSYPEAMKTYNLVKQNDKDTNFKIIYGIENYFVNDTDPLNMDAKDIPIYSDYICFDIETTGFSSNFDFIIEIGAIKLKKIEDALESKPYYIDIENHENFSKELSENTFQSFIKISKKIPVKINELTGITDEMISNAPNEKEVIMDFVNFCGENPILVAHNSQFDLSFLNAALKRHNINFKYKSLDSIPICKSQIPVIKNYKLGTVANYFDLGEFNAHRASDDARVLAIIFLKLIKLSIKNNNNSKYISDLFGKINIKKEFIYHQTILVKNKEGLKNLYKLVSISHLKYFYKKPRMPKSEITKHRNGLLIGSSCRNSDLFNSIIKNEPIEKIKEIAKFYDFLEIQPISNNKYLLDEGLISNIEDLKEINKKIVKLGDELNILVVATGDVHFLEPHDYKFREALMQAQGYKSGIDLPLFFRNTKEMLEEFSYLGKEKAFEVVVKNTKKICEMIEVISPIPKGVYPPNIKGAEEEITKISIQNSKDKYGKILPKIIEERLNKELESITKHGYSVLYIVAKKLVERSEQCGYLVGSRGSVGSSFVAFISGISEVNPLKPHYICIKCKNSEFILDNSYLSGFDLPDKKCPNCSSIYYKDGHDIPFETFLGFDGDKTPDIDLNFSGEYQLCAHKHTEEIFGKSNVFKAGTISTIAEKSAIGFIKKNIDDLNINITPSEARRLSIGITGIKRTTGQHPGGMIVVPENMEIYDFCPVQRPANDNNSESVTTHFDFHSIHDTICKLDELGHDVPTTYKYLEEYTGVPIYKVNMSDPKVYSLFTSTKALNVRAEEIDSKVGTFSLPEVGTFFVRQMLWESKPKKFSDLIQISGLSHGTNVWTDNARDLIKNNICTIRDVIGTRDDIMTYLISKGIDKKYSFKIMEIVRKGEAASKFTSEDEKNLKEHGIDQWYIDSCKKIKYMFPKAHATAYMIATIRLGWYKVYYPIEYYAAYFSAHGENVDYLLTNGGLNTVKNKLEEINSKGKEASIKEKSSISTLQILIEAFCRKIEFLPVDIYKSDFKKFLIEEKKIRLPLLSFSGLGEGSAKAIYETRKNGKFLSMDDLRRRAKISKTTTDLMKKLNIINLQESNQISFF